MNPTHHKTTKLFYNKWPYKLVLKHQRGRALKMFGPNYLIDCVLNKKGHQYYGDMDTGRFASTMAKYWEHDIQIRVERSNMSVFCKNEKLFYEMELDFKNWLCEIHEPANREELNFLMEQNRRKIVCNELPHGKYKFRVKIKSSMDVDSRRSFLVWLKKYDDKVKIATHTKTWFNQGHSGYGWDPNFLVEDSSLLTMAMLFLGGNARIIEEYVPRSSINTSQEQDNPCQHSASPLNLQTI